MEQNANDADAKHVDRPTSAQGCDCEPTHDMSVTKEVRLDSVSVDEILTAS
jgi:hypothetical protein